MEPDFEVRTVDLPRIESFEGGDDRCDLLVIDRVEALKLGILVGR